MKLHYMKTLAAGLDRIPWDRVNWGTSSFLALINALALIAVPAYLWVYGSSLFLWGLFFVLFVATGMSITLGYHRLFSHLSFKAALPVKLFVLIFGAAAFENSALCWAADHRKHHKHVDHDDDPYDISKGFFWAHIGWLIFKLGPEMPMDNVGDLRKDRLVMWQHSWWWVLALVVGIIIPTGAGYYWGGLTGAIGGFLIPGALRIFAVQHCTFFINSVCHTVGEQPYSRKCSAKDSFLMALFTFGEGYHNYHHEFQHDYRNGVGNSKYDPTKWTIWLLGKLGLAKDLRVVPKERILLAKIATVHEGWSNWLQHGNTDEQTKQTGDLDQIRARMQELQEAVAKRIEFPSKTIKLLERELRHFSRVLRQNRGRSQGLSFPRNSQSA